ncbi:hypothetical protein [Verrucomicrobium spinosum]|uniref:hypothetical protein n=1 Tax=Verrucomicrobium spinosum TaxID=2736 RepID=UPI000AB3C8B5|nr:hypothetical protein [Verrucomicrobium spinosum]
MLNNLRCPLVILGAICVLIGPLQGVVIDTPASASAGVIRSALEYYAKYNGGEIADSWDDFKGRFFSRDALEMKVRGSLPDRYTLFGLNGPKDEEKGLVVCVSNNSIREDRSDEDGRYVIWFKNSRFSLEWRTEQSIEEIFNRAQQQLPHSGMWIQPNTRHASEMQTNPGSLILDHKGNVAGQIVSGAVSNSSHQNAKQEDLTGAGRLPPVAISEPASKISIKEVVNRRHRAILFWSAFSVAGAFLAWKTYRKRKEMS